jgi:endonuclease/exonuclease/phosphatase family metal-dependent hydrolase
MNTNRFPFSGIKNIMAALLLLVAVLGQAQKASAQDTLRVLQYNLLYYGFNTSFCTSTNNNVDLKDGYLRTIVGHLQPDIFAVNELGRGEHVADRLLNNVLNIDGETKWARAAYTNTPNSSIVNMLYYDQEKFGLYDEAVVATVLRDINLYTLYYKDEALGQGGDTTFLSCIVVHLKAGSSVSDQQTRQAEVQATMNYIIENNIRGNVFFMGDLNMKSSFEVAYQLLTYHPNEAIRFYDPIDMPGLWFNNPDMAPFHTQSPRTGSHPCFVTGGLDDRYDFIMPTKPVMDGTLGLKYIEGSYRAVGQDGNRFNQNLIDPPNFSEPEEVIHALYHMSDHLPVTLKLLATEIVTSTSDIRYATPRVTYQNPVADNLYIKVDAPVQLVDLEVYSTTGELMTSARFNDIPSGASITVDVSHLPAGIYVIRVQVGNRQPYTGKLVIL